MSLPELKRCFAAVNCLPISLIPQLIKNHFLSLGADMGAR